MEPVLLWLRRDLRLADHPALTAAVDRGGPVIPVFVLDEVLSVMGAAARLRLEMSLRSLADDLAARGSRLILRRGRAADVLAGLVAETGARAVFWTRQFDPDAVARDRGVKAGLTAAGVLARGHGGHVLFPPTDVQTGTGGFYRVFTPFWRAVRGRAVPLPLPVPGRIAAPERWPPSDRLEDWGLSAAMDRGAAVVARHTAAGEAAAQARLAAFIDGPVARYGALRDMVAEDGTSGLSEYLATGEISAAACWHAGMAAMERGAAGAEGFLRELAWRDFAHHLAFHAPQIVSANFKPDWDRFAWDPDPDRPAVRAWMQGRTGIPLVDAGMRQMYVTGRMHNRVRMVAASYLTKHLLAHWRIGLDWFADCLTDWDPASNAMGWQWVAGSGPDAAPFFRIFNPVSQGEKFDPRGLYRRRWIAEGQRNPPAPALDWFAAIPRRWGQHPGQTYPDPVVTPETGRARALAALAEMTAAR